MCSYLGIAAGSAEEEEVDLIVNAASARAAEMTGRGVDENGYSRLISTSRTEYYDGDGTDTLLLKAYPITTVATVYVDPDRDYESTDLLDSGDYVYYGMDGTVKTDGALFSSGNKSVKITYTGGYTSIPYDLQLAIKELVMFWYKRNTDKRVGVSSISVGDKNVSYEKDVPQSVLSIFNRYKDHRGLVA
jgi:hypothetical protein